MYEEVDIPKHKKKRKSNASKSNKKSKHKHEYAECLIQYDFVFDNKTNRRTHLSSYCTICGKIGGRFKTNSVVKDYTRKTISESGKTYYSIIDDHKLLNDYKDKLPTFFVEDMLAEYVNLK